MQDSPKKYAIADTLYRLLGHTPIDKITVKLVAEACGINRQTFYYHFSDIYELMSWTLEKRLDEYMQEKEAEGACWQEVIRGFPGFLRLHRRAILNAYTPENRRFYERMLRRLLEAPVGRWLALFPDVERIPTEKRDFLLSVYTRIIVGLLLNWMDDGMPDESKLALDDFFTLAEGSGEQVVRCFLPKEENP